MMPDKIDDSSFSVPHFEGGLDPNTVPRRFHDAQALHIPGGLDVDIVNEGPVPDEYPLPGITDGSLTPEAPVADAVPPQGSPGEVDQLAQPDIAERLPAWRRAANFLGSLVTKRLMYRPQHMAKTSHYQGLAKGQSYHEVFGNSEDTPAEPSTSSASVTPNRFSRLNEWKAGTRAGRVASGAAVISPTPKVAEAPGTRANAFVSDMRDAALKIAAANAEADDRGLPRQERRIAPPTVREAGEKGWSTGGVVAGMDLGVLSGHRVDNITHRRGK